MPEKPIPERMSLAEQQARHHGELLAALGVRLDNHQHATEMRFDRIETKIDESSERGTAEHDQLSGKVDQLTASLTRDLQSLQLGQAARNGRLGVVNWLWNALWIVVGALAAVVMAATGVIPLLHR